MVKKLYGTDPDQVPTNADLGQLAYIDKTKVNSKNDAYSIEVMDASANALVSSAIDAPFERQAMQSLHFGISGQTVNIDIRPASGTNGTFYIHIGGYSSSGSGACQGVFFCSGHIANFTLFRTKEVDRYGYGNLSIASPSITSGLLRIPVTHDGTGQGGTIDVTVISAELNPSVCEITYS